MSSLFRNSSACITGCIVNIGNFILKSFIDVVNRICILTKNKDLFSSPFFSDIRNNLLEAIELSVIIFWYCIKATFYLLKQMYV